MAFDELFYPVLTRRSNYIGKGIGKVSRYTDYRDEIQEDCIFRCVYCDIECAEIGFEGMQLDHFRPEKHFPELSDDPCNLVLSCPKCNRLKWHYWPGMNVNEECILSNEVSILDPFECNRREYFIIDADGTASPLKGPARYMIELLKLNRNARVQLRRRRILRHQTEELLKDCNDLIEKLCDDSTTGKVSPDLALEKIRFLNRIGAEIRKLTYLL